MLVQHILQAKGHAVHTIAPTASLAEAARRLSKHRIGALVAVDRMGGVVGVISERDIVRGLADHAERLWNVEVSEVMSRDVKICALSDTVDHLMEVMTDNRVRHLPVLDKDRLVGLVSIGDVVKSRIHAIAEENHHLRDYIVGRDYVVETDEEKVAAE